MYGEDLNLKLVVFGSDDDALYVQIEAVVKGAHSYFARSPQVGALCDDMISKDSNKKTKLAAEKLYAQFMKINTMFGCRVFMRKFELLQYLSKFCQQWDVLFDQFDTNAKKYDVSMHAITNTFTVPGAGANPAHRNYHVLEAFAVLQRTYWLKKPSDEDIGIKLNILYNRSGKIIKLANEIEVLALVDRIEVELLENSFKALMQNAVEEGSHRGTIQSFWKSILENDILSNTLSAFCKLAAIMLVIPIGFVENKRVFSAMNYIKDEKRNRLRSKHLNVYIRVKRSSVHSAKVPISSCVGKMGSSLRASHVLGGVNSQAG
ncbi:hypothetical protein AXG93_4698s1050 [Marchantia polymorpha subsp. ruderalis]|uniref:HAT C-terminal dimerisation domain-containing protein n=1 Tax=Marchantia polymorpha subsp. ruderalis TaxID=1480154 RepID=A0A176VKH9_MARPO|nr:hypothetical protein AXG93_4698s1050 [Marchantia polymorpha subsp. ruderalis]